jgi:hypothetical protein
VPHSSRSHRDEWESNPSPRFCFCHRFCLFSLFVIPWESAFVFVVAFLACHPQRGSASVVSVALFELVILTLSEVEGEEEPPAFPEGAAKRPSVVAVASKVQRGFSPASKSRRKAATALPKAGAQAQPKRLIYCLFAVAVRVVSNVTQAKAN